MADENINASDEVSWKRSDGNSAGTVEVVVSSSIEIETKNGNTIENNGSEGNHAVQDRNDVVERASELEMEGRADDKGNETQADKKEPDTGEKRGRGDADGGLETASGEDRESAERVEERDAKKPKTGEVEDTGIKNGSNKIDDNREEKDDKQEDKEPTIDAVPKDVQTAPKKRGPGRPKKSDSKTSPPAGETKDSIGKRTRSKA